MVVHKLPFFRDSANLTAVIYSFRFFLFFSRFYFLHTNNVYVLTFYFSVNMSLYCNYFSAILELIKSSMNTSLV